MRCALKATIRFSFLAFLYICIAFLAIILYLYECEAIMHEKDNQIVLNNMMEWVGLCFEGTSLIEHQWRTLIARRESLGDFEMNLGTMKQHELEFWKRQMDRIR